MKVRSEPFVLLGKPVRLVEWNWRADPDYKNSDAVDSLYVTWGDYPLTSTREQAPGWVGDVWQVPAGAWVAGDDRAMLYATAEDAAFGLVMRWIGYEKTLTAADQQKLWDAYARTFLLPGTKAPPRENAHARKPRKTRRRRS